MSGIQHRDLAAGRWYELTLCEQLGNVGSEVSRAIRWTSRNPTLEEGAWHRALELLDRRAPTSCSCHGSLCRLMCLAGAGITQW
jgi:hypothetical protein